MNETIRRILSESGTKTSKIRKLLLIGLSHREIADLVTRGNRGFVWNVYKRMRDEGLLPASQTATVLRPEPDTILSTVASGLRSKPTTAQDRP